MRQMARMAIGLGNHFQNLAFDEGFSSFRFEKSPDAMLSRPRWAVVGLAPDAGSHRGGGDGAIGGKAECDRREMPLQAEMRAQ